MSEKLAHTREQQLKTGFGRAYLKRRLGSVAPARKATLSVAGG
nr:hypothetical protein [uncultured bacterium]